MAKVLGAAGRYVTEQSIKKYLRMFLFLYLFTLGLGVATGCLLAKQNFLVLLLLLLSIPVWIHIKKKIAILERERLNFRKGATGEAVVGFVLDRFPDSFHVIHDLTTPFGNIDHVVVGPTGVYVIDAKNWKGVVTADGNSELLLNSRPTQKAEIKNLTRRIMGIREKAKVLSSLEPYMQGVFVFPSAHIDAKIGSTGYIHCITDEQLYDYIVENKQNKKLSSKEIESISQAFLALARMDKDFA